MADVTVDAAGREVRITSADRVVFPVQGWTKLDIVDHFILCGEGALRGVSNRPTMLKRWTKGVAFYDLHRWRAPGVGAPR